MPNQQFIDDCLVTEAPVTVETYDRLVEGTNPHLREVYSQLVLLGGYADALKRQVFYNTDPKPQQYEEWQRIGEQLSTNETDLLFSGVIAHVSTQSLPGVSEMRRVHAYLGMLSEIAELALPDLANIRNRCLERIGPLYPTTRQNQMEEVGDLLWYIAIFLDASGVGTIEDCCNFVIAKLKERYKDKFKVEETENRNVDAELSAGEQAVKQGTYGSIPRTDPVDLIIALDSIPVPPHLELGTEPDGEATREQIEEIRARGEAVARELWPEEYITREAARQPIQRELELVNWMCFRDDVKFVRNNHSSCELEKRVSQIEGRWSKIANTSHETEHLAALRADYIWMFAHMQVMRDRISSLTNQLDAQQVKLEVHP